MGCRVPILNNVDVVYLPDSSENRVIVRQAFEVFEADGTLNTLFYDGSIETPEAFERFLFRPGSLPFVLFGDIQPVGLCWVNNITGRAAHGHLAVFKAAWGRKNTERIAKAVFHRLLAAQDAGGFLFDVLIGICPENNALVWKLGETCGAVRRCVIPNYIYRHATGVSENAVLYTVTRENLR